MNDTSIGTVNTQIHKFSDEFVLESGKKLDSVQIAYETYGTLNDNKSNAILIAHAFSGDAHVAGFHEGDKKPGWWDAMIGPGKAFDTDKYFIICSNIIGGCGGSTGPSSVDPKTEKPYGLSFPIITMVDIVNAQCRLIDHFAIDKLLCVCGGSMGGMQVLQWVNSFPERVKSAIPVASAMKHSPQQIAFNEVGRQAIMADPKWNQGEYYDDVQPEKGLAVARMIGHITYMSDESMEEKFSRKLKEEESSFNFSADFEVESYLRYRGDSFVKRFDANSYLYITKAMDYFDLSEGKLISKDKSVDTKFLVIGFQSDWLYPSYQLKEMIQSLKIRGVEATFCDIKSRYGHDAFLVEHDEQTKLMRPFLKRIFKEVE
jgi:homoserine O-acetyltransferase